jgi:triacylglycerol esterase/lipase EstA (alpha/beta hydrolase family)
VVTIATPHHGTALARFSRLPNGRQMRIGGEWLDDLSRAAGLPASRFTCWFSNCDNVVMPPSTATLQGADNRFLPGAAHVDLAFRETVVEGTFALVRDL